MADIAMLVAEEYERRVRNSRKSSGADGEEIQLLPHVSVSAKRLQGSSFSWIKSKIGEEKMEFLEPKSEIAEAASGCFFSA